MYPSNYSEGVQKILEIIHLRKNIPTPSIQRGYRKPYRKHTPGKTYPLQLFRVGTEIPRKIYLRKNVPTPII